MCKIADIKRTTYNSLANCRKVSLLMLGKLCSRTFNIPMDNIGKQCDYLKKKKYYSIMVTRSTSSNGKFSK